jgi:formate dehydrogenase maturation protein FdhE
MRAADPRRNTLQLDPHVELLMALASAAAWLMMRAGLAKNALEMKRKRNVCPSCGRHDGCNCV